MIGGGDAGGIDGRDIGGEDAGERSRVQQLVERLKGTSYK